MKMPRQLMAQNAGPVWGLACGVFLTAAGIGLWLYAVFQGASLYDESIPDAVIVAGVCLAVYAAREICRGYSSRHDTKR